LVRASFSAYSYRLHIAPELAEADDRFPPTPVGTVAVFFLSFASQWAGWVQNPAAVEVVMEIKVHRMRINLLHCRESEFKDSFLSGILKLMPAV
jgi:hypothetical protein